MQLQRKVDEQVSVSMGTGPRGSLWPTTVMFAVHRVLSGAERHNDRQVIG